MKKLFALKNLWYAALPIVLLSCKKDIPGTIDEDATFNASLVTARINAGDTAVFALTENPDIISFYSGEIGHEYQYRDRTILEGGNLKVKFETRLQNVGMDSSLEVMISNDFSGVYDSTNVVNAHWKNMNSFFTYPLPTDPLSTFYPSGPTQGDFADFTDSIIPGQPFYYAFKYTNKTPSSIIWSINKMSMYNVFSAGNIPDAVIIDSNRITSGNFASVQINDPGIARWTTSSTYLKCTNTSTTPVGAEYWYITRPLNPSAIAPDAPIVIKNITQNPMTAYRYTYTKPGTYKATFVARYARLNFQKTIVREFTVIVD